MALAKVDSRKFWKMFTPEEIVSGTHISVQRWYKGFKTLLNAPADHAKENALDQPTAPMLPNLSTGSETPDCSTLNADITTGDVLERHVNC